MHQSRTLTLPRFSPLTRPGRIAAYLTASLIAFGLFLAQSSTARASTSVTESITTNTTWTKAGSPYDLDAVQLEVKEGATLTIDAGVTVDFNVSEYFFIYGTINAVGTEAEPVVFTSHEGLEGLGQPGQYAGVLVRSKNAKSSFSHTTFRYGGYSTAFHSTTAPLDINEEHTTVAIDHSNFEYSQHFGLHIDSYDGTGIVSNSTFAHNESGIAVSNNSVLDLSRSLIAENTGVGVELIIEWSEIPTGSSFLYNTITGNGSRGIWFSRKCTSPLASFPHGEYNNVYGNGSSGAVERQLYANYKCNAVPVDWSNNYWGPSVYYRHNDQQCMSTETPYLGHLAYTWSKRTYEWQVPKGPIEASYHAYTAPYHFECAWDTVKIGPNEFLTSPVEGSPEPPPSAIFGEPGLFAPFLPSVNCGDPVNCITGNFHETRTDLKVPGLNDGLTFARSYNSLAAREGVESALGHGWSFEYGEKLSLDPSGTAATITNADGSRVTFTEEAGTWTAPAWVQATLLKNGDGTFSYTLPDQRIFKFSSAGKLLSITDRNNNETTVSYSEGGQLTTVTDPSGRKLTFAYNASGRVESVTDPEGHKATFGYSASDDLVSVNDPGEVSESYEYSGNHLLTVMTNPRGGKTQNYYDEGGRVTSQADPMERNTKWVYGAGASEVTLPTGAITKIAFEDNLPTEITHAYGTAQASTTKYEYNENLYPVKVTDANGRATEYGYDAEGNRTSEKDALGHETSWTYNGKHEVTSITTPRGEKTTIERDVHGNPDLISRPAPGEATQLTSFEYDSQGLLESLTDPLGHVWRYGYDKYGDRTDEVDPEGDTRTMDYDEDSRLVSVVSPRGNIEGAIPGEYETKIERNAQGWPTKVTNALGHATEYGYDAAGNLTSRTDAAGHKTTYVYDADNERTEVEKPSGAILKTGYDALGEVTSETGGNGHTTKYVRNVLERPVEVIDSLKRTTMAEYDAAGNLTSLTDAAGGTTSYEYDAANHLTTINFSDGVTPTAVFSYDKDNNVTRMVDGSGESTFSYDLLDRLTESKDGHGSTVSYEYNLGDALSGITYPNGKAISRAFDKSGRLKSVTDWLGNTTSFAYTPDSGLTKTTFPESTGEADEYTYDRSDMMSGATFGKGADTLASLSYARTDLGQIESTNTIGLPGASEVAYGYDENGRLTQAGSSAFGYDAADNLTSAPGTTNSYDAADQLESGTGLSYAYDKLGERTRRTPEVGAATSYGYDQAGDLTSVERPAEGEAPAIGVNYAYDSSGLLASRSSGGTTAYLTWDQGAELPVPLADGERSYVYGPGDIAVEQIEGETAAFLHHDQLGSTRMLTNAAGEAIGKFTYSPYGSLEALNGGGTTPLGFAGQYTDPVTGLQYLGARFYDPATGQFMSRDPLEALTRAPYSYAADNPIQYVDRSGLIFGIPGTPSTGEVLGGIKEGGEAVGGAVYEQAGTISTVAGAATFVPGVDVVAGPIALAAGGLQAYKEARAGNYVGAGLAGVGVAAGGFAEAARAESEAWNATRGSLWSRGYMQPWAADRAATWASRAQTASVASFALSGPFGEIINPNLTWGTFCIP